MFEVHKLNERGMGMAHRLQVTFETFLSEIVGLCSVPPVVEGRLTPSPNGGRELALVRTHLEIASFYAKRAMALCPENQEQP